MMKCFQLDGGWGGGGQRGNCYRILSNYGAKNYNLRLALALILERKNYTPTSTGASVRVALSKWNVPYETNGVFYLARKNVEAQLTLYLE